MVARYSIEGALPSLTLEIERDPVYSRRYGRSWKKLQYIVDKPQVARENKSHYPEIKIVYINIDASIPHSRLARDKTH